MWAQVIKKTSAATKNSKKGKVAAGKSILEASGSPEPPSQLLPNME